ncbi:MAG: hypothetical protein K5795_07240 [Lachnospiraceae bacterium]|nr:hypothetical protein [Lachnospiraceae bacterium]
MDRYKNFVKIEEIKGLLRREKYEEALEMADGIDPSKLKDNLDCMIIGEVYLNNGMLGRAKECYAIVYGRRKTRRVAMELVNICIRLKKADEAEKYFADYKKMAPNDYYNYIFQYKIDRLRGKSLKEQAASLEKLKKIEFTDTWGYELAKLYHKMGDTNKVLRTCDDIIVWFGDGDAVEKAKALKAYYLGEISLKDLNSPKESTDTDDTDAIDAAIEKAKAAENAENDEEVDEATISAIKKYRATWNGEAPEDNTEEAEKTSDVQQETVEEAVPEAEQDNGNTGYTEEPEVILASEEPEENGPEAEISVAAEEPAEYMAETASEEDVIEEEYTEEDLMIADEKKVEEERPIKVAITRPVHETDYFEDEIAKAVEQALIEDSTESKERPEPTNPGDMTRVWNKPEIDALGEGEKDANRTIVIPPVKEKQNAKKAADDYEDIKEDEPKSQLLEAVERELGFVEDSPKEKAPAKKSWVSRWKEKLQEKERRKQDELQKQKDSENDEKLKKECEAELEKQRFIESERKKDRRKFLDHQKQLAKLANEKALKAEAEQENSVKKEKPADEAYDAEDFKVDISDSFTVEDIGVVRTPEDGIYTPKKLKCIEVPKNSPIYGYLEKTGKTLEDYFGFFACQKDMNAQILKCLEALADPMEGTMNYCIIGEKGTGKKSIAHGFAKFMADCGLLASSQTVWTDANKVNMTNLKEKDDKLKGRCLVINQAGDLSDEAIWDISDIVKKLGRKTMIVIADYRRNMVELFKNREKFEDMFRPRVIIPAFNQDDLFDYVDYKIGNAGFVFDSDAYDLISKRIKGIMRATEEGALARTEKYLVKTLDNAEQRNGEAYIRQTLEHEKHVRSNVIISKDIPNSI